MVNKKALEALIQKWVSEGDRSFVGEMLEDDLIEGVEREIEDGIGCALGEKRIGEAEAKTALDELAAALKAPASSHDNVNTNPEE